jgi:acyl-CoA thioester hydrolase
LSLVNRTEVIVRFNEADPLGIVWHGHYIRYFEDGREAFGRQFGCSYLDFYKQGLVTPIVSVNCDYKKPLKYGDTIIVETSYIDEKAAKFHFTYKILDPTTSQLIALGSTMQVFVDAKSYQLQLVMPPFFVEWKRKWVNNK